MIMLLSGLALAGGRHGPTFGEMLLYAAKTSIDYQFSCNFALLNKYIILHGPQNSVKTV